MQTYNRIIVFNCTEAWAPICIYLHVSGQNESVQLKPIDTLLRKNNDRAGFFVISSPVLEHKSFIDRSRETFGSNPLGSNLRAPI